MQLIFKFKKINFFFIKKYLHLVLAILSGILLAFSHAPFNFYPLAWFSFSPIIWFTFFRTEKKANFLILFLFASFYFGITLSWITSINFWYDGGGTLALFIFIFIANLITITWYFLLRFSKLFLLKKGTISLTFLYFMPAFIWTFLEWIRQFGKLGSTLAVLAYSQWNFLEIIQISNIIGLFGISFLLLLSNSWLAIIFNLIFKKFNKLTISKQEALASLIFSLFFALFIIFAFNYGNHSLKKPHKAFPLQLVSIQTNVSQAKKLNPFYFGELKKQYLEDMLIAKKIFDTKIRKDKPRLILMPETIIPALISNDKPFMSEIRNIFLDTDIYLIFGIPVVRDGLFYNAALVFLSGEMMPQYYAKRQLVPFGEYLPFRNFLRKYIVKNNFFHNDYSSSKENDLLKLADLKIGLGICFESMFPMIYKQFSVKEADILIVITNNAWFLKSGASAQHLAASVFRAVENNLWLVHNANTGISAIIDPKGRINAKTLLDEKSFIYYE